jgi:hypothetical protein
VSGVALVVEKATTTLEDWAKMDPVSNGTASHNNRFNFQRITAFLHSNFHSKTAVLPRILPGQGRLGQ